jgi:hypothetical protein
MGGSMGSVVGEKFVRAAQLSMDTDVPLVCFSASGGALQIYWKNMAKTTFQSFWLIWKINLILKIKNTISTNFLIFL